MAAALRFARASAKPEGAGVLRVGLTGGIACGKSVVARLFAAHGSPVVNDDVAARDAVAAGTPGFAVVVREFGDVVGPDGEIDRVLLGRIVFADAAKRRRLMEVTFPFIGELLRDRLAAAERTEAWMVVYESALLFENGAAEAWRPVVVVRTTKALQIERLRLRNGLDTAEAERRVAAQMPVEEKVRRADYVIDNVGTLAEVERRFEEIFSELRRRAGLAPDVPAPALNGAPDRASRS